MVYWDFEESRRSRFSRVRSIGPYLPATLLVVWALIRSVV